MLARVLPPSSICTMVNPTFGTLKCTASKSHRGWCWVQSIGSRWTSHLELGQTPRPDLAYPLKEEDGFVTLFLAFHSAHERPRVTWITSPPPQCSSTVLLTATPSTLALTNLNQTCSYHRSLSWEDALLVGVGSAAPEWGLLRTRPFKKDTTGGTHLTHPCPTSSRLYF